LTRPGKRDRARPARRSDPPCPTSAPESSVSRLSPLPQSYCPLLSCSVHRSVLSLPLSPFVEFRY
jgi:hypothetical protein